MLYSSAVPSDPDVDSLPSLPSGKTARTLVDAVFLYVQARYCIVDWAQVREWHRDRESLAYVPNDAPNDSQTGKNMPISPSDIDSRLISIRGLFHLDYLRYWRPFRGKSRAFVRGTFTQYP